MKIGSVLTLTLAGILLSCAQSSDDLLVDYPPVTPKEVKILSEGKTRKAIGAAQKDTEYFVRSAVDIKVRMFPILSAPYKDPYPVVRDPFLVELKNIEGLRIFDVSDNLLAEGNVVKFDFREKKFLVDQKSVALQPLRIDPRTHEKPTQMVWDRGQKDSQGQSVEMAVAVRGQFVVEPTTYTQIAARLVPTIDKYFPPKKNTKQRQLWTLINDLSLNQYLQSVLPSEINAKWHPESVRAQAIAARTYALYEMTIARQNPDRRWDVDPTTWYQSYRGVVFRRGKKDYLVETDQTNDAVKNSRHKVITFNGEVIKSFFSANSGGITCSAKECFDLKGPNPPFLISVPDADGVKEAPFGTWGMHATVNRKTIKERLLVLGFPASIEVDYMTPALLGESQRVWQLKVVLQNGEELLLDKSQSKSMMALYGSIRSHLYSLSMPNQTGQQEVKGHGFGHGVGMSQFGAKLFAEAGWDADKIITYYYRNTKIFQITGEDEP